MSFPYAFPYPLGGEPANIVSGVNLVGDDVVILSFLNEVVIDTTYRNTSTYSIEVIKGSGEISIKRVIPPTTGLTTNTVILYVTKPTKGTLYRVTISTSLRGRDGTPISGTIDFIGHRTKLETMLKGVPTHWDKRPEGVMRNILAAISIEDDRIGGAGS